MIAKEVTAQPLLLQTRHGAVVVEKLYYLFIRHINTSIVVAVPAKRSAKMKESWRFDFLFSPTTGFFRTEKVSQLDDEEIEEEEALSLPKC